MFVNRTDAVSRIAKISQLVRFAFNHFLKTTHSVVRPAGYRRHTSRSCSRLRDTTKGVSGRETNRDVL